MGGTNILSVLIAFVAGVSILFAFKLAVDMYWQTKYIRLESDECSSHKWRRPESITF